MQNLVRAFAFMLVVLLAAASAVVDSQTTNAGSAAEKFSAVINPTELE